MFYTTPFYLGKDNQARELVRVLVDKALMTRFFTDGVRESSDRPGRAIENLPEREREILRGLKAEDIANERWPLMDGLNLEKLPRRLK